MDTNHNSENYRLCPLTMRLLESIESPVEHCRNIHTQNMQDLLGRIHRDMEVAALRIKLSDESLQRRILFRLKTELMSKIDILLMSSERKDYLLHQLSNVHETDELVSLLQEINVLQAKEESIVLSDPKDIDNYEQYRKDLLYIAETPSGIIISKQAFNLIAGVFSDNIDKESLPYLRKIAQTEDFLLLRHELNINETLQSSLQAVESKGKQLIQSTVAITGATGDVMSLTSEILARQVKKLILLHHSPVEVSPKFQKTILRIILELVQASEESALVRTIKDYWINGTCVVDFLELPAVQEVLIASTDLETLREADIVLCGNCPTAGFLTLDYFQPNAIIIDLTGSSALDQEMLSEMQIKRPDLSYHVIFQKQSQTLA